MAGKGSYIIVGENIHCTRVKMTSGKFVGKTQSGQDALVFKAKGATRYLPIPASFVESEEWASGKVKHVQVAIRQGMHGKPDEAAEGVAYLHALAAEQEASGAWFLDVNVDEYSMDIDEKIVAMEWVAKVLQSASTVPLSIDSSEPRILEAGLAACNPARGKPMVNSVSLERTAMIAIAAKAKACVIAGATGERSMPEGVADRIDNIHRLMALLGKAGIGHGDIYLDPLVMPVSVNTANPGFLLDAVASLRKEYGPAIHFAPGLSNVSYGLPKRPVINQVFAWLALKAGCDGGIVDPAQINDTVLSALDVNAGQAALARDLLQGKDEYGMNWISSIRDAQG